MQIVKVTAVEFDFSCDDGHVVTNERKKYYHDKVVGKYFILEHEDDLADEISDETGWCVLSVQSETIEYNRDILTEMYSDRRVQNMRTEELEAIVSNQIAESCDDLPESEFLLQVLRDDESLLANPNIKGC